MPELFVGLMSGTSLDGIDAVLADFGDATPRFVGADHRPLAPALRSQLLALQFPSANELHVAALAGNDLAHAYAESVKRLVESAGVDASRVRAVGCHGQTIRHQPDAGYTIQLVNGALLAELTAIDVVCDFRSRDIAAGGQGAPLVPSFHQAVFGSATAHRAVVNIGGLANITDIPAAGAVSGFDCGPGNVLMDAWSARHLGVAYDEGGRWASSGELDSGLLQRLLAHEYFARRPPKSTGRETFNLGWLDSVLSGAEDPADVQRTLLALTARSIADAIASHCPGTREIYLCGGGARNTALSREIAALLPSRKVSTTDSLGIAAEHVEAFAFAWLARQYLAGKPGNVPTVTGARGARVLGALYPA